MRSAVDHSQRAPVQREGQASATVGTNIRGVRRRRAHNNYHHVHSAPSPTLFRQFVFIVCVVGVV